MTSEAYSALDKQWKAACRIVLGGEIGSIDGYSKWLSGLNDPLTIRASSSGKKVVMTSSSYCAGSPVSDMGSVDYMKKFEPLSIYDIACAKRK